MLRLGSLPDPASRRFEMVERKGIGHPDTICDALAEEASLALCRHYAERFGFVLHHNLDKVLLVGGASAPRFGGGEVLAPIEIIIAGRASFEHGGIAVPVEALVIESARAWLRRNLRHLDLERDVRVTCRVRPGSADLVDLYRRQSRTGRWLANDTSFGAGFAPLSPLERAVLAAEHALNSPQTRHAHPALGEDVKIMGVRDGAAIDLTVACAMIGRHLPDENAYEAARSAAASVAARAADLGDAGIAVNAADDPASGSYYLTVTGTSAEAGDDGEAGRGNRASGLITPGRPMTLEGVAGKNPVTHVGKLYNVLAPRIAAEVVAKVKGVRAAECYLVSRIGRPVAEPQLAELRLATEDGVPPETFSPAVAPIVADNLAGLADLWRDFVAGRVPVF